MTNDRTRSLEIHALLKNGERVQGWLKLDTTQHSRLFDFIQSPLGREIAFQSPRIFKNKQITWQSEQDLLIYRQYMVFVGEVGKRKEGYHISDRGKLLQNPDKMRTPFMFNLNGLMAIGLYSHEAMQRPKDSLQRAQLFNLSNVILMEDKQIEEEHSHLVINNEYVFYRGEYEPDSLQTSAENRERIRQFLAA